MRDQGVGRFRLARVHIERIFFQRVLALVGTPLNVDDVIVRLVELTLREIGKETFVAAVAVDDKNFFAAVTRHLVGGFLQEIKLNLTAVGDGAWLVLGFENLPEIVFGKNDSEFFLGGVQRGVTHVEKICAERKMGAVFFQNADRENAGAFGEFDGLAKIGGGELFPVGGKSLLSRKRGGGERKEQK